MVACSTEVEATLDRSHPLLEVPAEMFGRR